MCNLLVSTLILNDFYCEWLFVNGFWLWFASGWMRKERDDGMNYGGVVYGSKP